MDMMDDSGAPATKADVRSLSEATKVDIGSLRDATKAAVAATQADIRSLREETKADIAGVKSDILGLRETFKSDMLQAMERLENGLRTEIRSVRRDLALEIVKTNARIDRLEVDLRAEMAGRSSALVEKIDGFMSKTEKVDRAQIIADWRLAELEKRVATIEPRPS